HNLGGVSSWDASSGSLGWGAGYSGAYGAGYGGAYGAGWGAGWGGDAAYLGGASYGGGYDASLVGGGLSGYESYAGSAGLVGDASLYLGGASYDAGSLAINQVQYASDAQGLYQDPNPTIIRRAAPGGVHTYTQNVQLRFLQPPPVPPPGVSHFYH
ncbi:unnamed protein product, partial [Rotaria sordida]